MALLTKGGFMPKLNYYYEPLTGTFELYDGDTLLVDLPYADPMTPAQAHALAGELWADYLENKGN
jgi:hypothetical protein